VVVPQLIAMKNPLEFRLKNFTLLAVLISAALWLSSCGSDDEPKDTTSPEVSFTDLTVDKPVWNTVPIKIDANDNQGIATMDVFVDGNLVTTITETPYETTWDSNTVSDGSHIVKVVVTDMSGNKVEKAVTIVVKNILVKFDFAADQLAEEDDYKERGFVFLSDESGKVIASAEYSNGQHLELKSPTFNGEKFYLTEVLQDEREGDDFVRLWTFVDLDRGGKWVVLDDREYDQTYAGEASLSFTNAAASAFYNVYSNGDETGAAEWNTSAVIRIHKNPSKLYIVRNNEEGSPAPTYGLFSNIVTGANGAINLNSVNQALTKVTTSVPDGATYASVEIDAFPVADNYSERYTLSRFATSNPGPLDIYHPGAAFPSYHIESYYQTETLSYGRASRTEFGNFSIPTHNTSFSFANNKLTYSATGNYDMVTASYVNDNESGYWTLVLPLGSTLSIPVLELPTALTSLDIPAIGTPAYHGIHDYEGIDNYDGLKTFIKNSAYSTDELFAYGKNYVSVDFLSTSHTGGRLKKLTRYVSVDTEIRKRK